MKPSDIIVDRRQSKFADLTIDILEITKTEEEVDLTTYETY